MKILDIVINNTQAILTSFVAIMFASLGIMTAAQIYSTQVVSADSSSQVYRWGGLVAGSGGSSSGYPVEDDSPTAAGNLTDIVSVDAGNADTYALQCVGGQSSCSTDGVVWDWGNNEHGQLGNGTVTKTTGSWLTDPVQVQFPSGTNIISIGESEDAGYAIDSNGQAWAWGLSQRGSLCLGDNGKTKNVPTPVMIPGLTGAQAVQGGQNHVLWLMNDGTVEACGNNVNGQLGNGTTTSSSSPVHVSNLTNIVQISSGDISSGAVDASGNLYMWGSDKFGMDGNGKNGGNLVVPTLVNLPNTVQEVSVGGSLSNNGSTVALLTDGTVYSWGNNKYGQLGNGNAANQSLPVQVKVPNGVTFVNVATGGTTSYAVDSNGNVWSWGQGNGGQLGNGQSGNKVKSNLPIEIDSNATMVSATAQNAADLHSN